MLFSQKRGLSPASKSIQTDSMDDELRTGLWNLLDIFCWERQDRASARVSEGPLNVLIKRLWFSFFKRPLDTINNYWPTTYGVIREEYYGFPWYRVFDFIEFVLENDDGVDADVLTKACNHVLQRECSGYRLVGGRFTEITGEEELTAIDEALEGSDPYPGVRTHLARALELMADRKSPDYRNSIKESVSAVEALCRLIKRDPKASLGEALGVLKAKVGLHPALEKAFSGLYGYTSDADGIRHALMDEPQLSFEDAKFMLVACSAFVSYLLAKAGKAGLQL